MNEHFFQSPEFANLLDVLVALIFILIAPVLLAVLPRLSRRQQVMLVGGVSLAIFARALAIYESAYILLSQFPFAPALARCLQVLSETLSYWLFAGFLLFWRRTSGARAIFAISGVLVLAAGLSSLLGGWQRTALLQASFNFRTEAELLLIALKGALVLIALIQAAAIKSPGRRFLVTAALLALSREAALGSSVAGASDSLAWWSGLYTHLALGGTAGLGTWGLTRLEGFAVRSGAFRVLMIGFIGFSTVVTALSFNYLLRVRMLDEALSRYRGEAEKIGSDISRYLGRLERQIEALATPEIFASLAYPAEPSQPLASLPHEFLLEDFRFVGFYSSEGEPLRFYSQSRERVPESVIDDETRAALLAAPTDSWVLLRNFDTHGSLFYEVDNRLRIRSDRPESQPELVLLAAVPPQRSGVAGYVEAVLPTRRLQRFFAGYGSDTGWDFLATNGGLILAHGTGDYVGYDLSEFPDLFEQTSRSASWQKITLPGGSNYVVTGSVEGHPWAVGRVLSTQTILGALRKLRGETFVIVVVMLGSTSFAAFLFSGLVSRQRLALERMELELDHKQAIEQKNVELSVERKKIETILLSIGEGVIVCDVEDRILFINRIVEVMLRRSPDDMRGRRAADLGIQGLSDALGAVQAEWRSGVRRPDIQEFFVQLAGADLKGNLAPIIDEAGQYQGAVIILQDISELMKLDRLKTEIISIVSHSLRTPLTSIKSFTEILKAKTGKLEPAKESEYLDIIDFSADRLTRIVNNILDLSKIAGGKMQYAMREVPLRELLEESVMIASGAAEAKDLTIESHLDGYISAVVDRSKMMQVFDNVIGNAIKFTRNGGRLDVRMVSLTGAQIMARYSRNGVNPEGNYALIEFRDTGVGISEGNLERIFDRFFQGDYMRESNEGGTGLGLAISREYVLAHGGHIWASSTPGEGSTFHIVLPANAA